MELSDPHTIFTLLVSSTPTHHFRIPPKQKENRKQTHRNTPHHPRHEKKIIRPIIFKLTRRKKSHPPTPLLNQKTTSLPQARNERFLLRPKHPLRRMQKEGTSRPHRNPNPNRKSHPRPIRQGSDKFFRLQEETVDRQNHQRKQKK